MSRRPRTIRYSDEEWAASKRLAQSVDMKRSDFIRELSTGRLGPTSIDTRRQLRLIGLQLERLIEASEEAGEEHDSIAIGQVLDQLKEVLLEVGGYGRAAAPSHDAYRQVQALGSGSEEDGKAQDQEGGQRS